MLFCSLPLEKGRPRGDCIIHNIFRNSFLPSFGGAGGGLYRYLPTAVATMVVAVIYNTELTGSNAVNLLS